LLNQTNINDNLNLFDLERVEPFFNYYYKKNKLNLDYVINLFSKDFNLKFLYKLNNSDHFFSSINKFFDFNLLDFYNLKNRFESYKDVMAINSVYEYRFANNSFKTMEEFILTIFKTPLENYIYFNELYKNYSYKIISSIFSTVEKNGFFNDLMNNDKFLSNHYNLFNFYSRLFKMRTYVFKFHHLFDLIKNEDDENLLRIDVFSKFYKIFENKSIFRLVQKFRRKNLYKK